MKYFLAVCAATGLAMTMAHPSRAMSGELIPGYYLFRSQYQYEPSRCFYHLEMQDDGNLVTYAGPATPTSGIWSTGTNIFRGFCNGDSGGDITLGCIGELCGKGVFATLQGGDGNFVVRGGTLGCLWATNVINYNLPGDLFQQVDGNLVVYDAYGAAKWASNQSRPWFTGTCPSPKGKKTLVGNGNRGGYDYAVRPLSSPSWALCGDMCAHESRCRAWTYVPPGWAFTNAAGCWLKDSIPALSGMNGVVSGAIIIDP